MRLTFVEGRVIGSLIEKQLTTPQHYPLTLNALVGACNQSSNRDPVVTYDEGTVEGALVSLKEAGLLRFVHPSYGRSALRYRQVVEEGLGLDERGLGLLAVLLLRGPQTIGELRGRTDRMAEFTDLRDVEHELVRMSEGETPLVVRLPRRPGQKEERWQQLIAPAGAGAGVPVSPSADATPGPPSSVSETGRDLFSGPQSRTGPDEAMAELRQEVGALRQEVGELREVVNDLRRSLGD